MTSLRFVLAGFRSLAIDDGFVAGNVLAAAKRYAPAAFARISAQSARTGSAAASAAT
jgi:hypothetical protein